MNIIIPTTNIAYKVDFGTDCQYISQEFYRSGDKVYTTKGWFGVYTCLQVWMNNGHLAA